LEDNTNKQWWDAYQKYAEEHGIIFQDADFEKPILRGEFIEWAYTLSEGKSEKIPEIFYTYHKDFTDLYREYKNNHFMENVLSDILQRIQIPKGLSFKYDSCDEANAFYSPENHTITLCYELINQYKQQIQEHPESF